VLFHSQLFLLGFLPLVAVVYWLLSPGPRRWWLLASSLVFYGWAGWRFPALLAGMTALSFVASRAPRRIGLVVALSNLLVLGIVKYYDLVVTTFKDVDASGGAGVIAPFLRVVMPVGISFYTFNLLSYNLDVYRRATPSARSFGDLLRYASFFPTISAGPLMRYGDFRAQLQAETKLDPRRLELGLFNLGLGLAKKLVIADWIGQVIDPLWRSHAALGVGGAWLAVVGYHFRLYFDFSGYCDMAVGAGHLLGIQVPANFRAPYTSRSITEFWQRWHITLSTWFRDYLFLPLSRSLLRRSRGRQPEEIRSVSLLLTMSLIGLWHGPTWTYVVWGAYQGLLLAIHANARSWNGRPWPAWAGRTLTTFSVLLGWVPFASGSLGMAANLYAAMLGLKGWGPPLTSFPGVGPGFLLLLGGLVVLTNLPWDVPDLEPRRELGYALSLAGLIVVALLLVQQPTAFIYFQF